MGINLLAWQFLFIVGILLGNLRLRGYQWSVLSKRWAVPVAAVLALCIAWVCMAANLHRLATAFHKDFWRIHRAQIAFLTD
jgi:hypothetical protein